MGVDKNSRGVELHDLSKEQKEVLYYLTEEFLTPSKISKIRGTSSQAVYKTINKLKKKGFLRGIEKGSFHKGVDSHTPRISDNKKVWRLHALSLRIRILNKTESFYKFIKKNRKPIIDNNTIDIQEEYILIYSNKDFESDSVESCIRLALDYFSRFIILLEQSLKLILLKVNNDSIEYFKGEIAKVGDEIAKDILIKKEKLKIVGNDNKPRVIADFSFKKYELEFVSSHTYQEDAKRYEEFIKDLLEEEETIKLSDLKKLSANNTLRMQELLLITKGLVQEVQKLKNK